MDPISLLREYVSERKLKEVTTSGDRINFGDRFSFSRHARTAYKSRSRDGTFYDLGTLLFFARSLGPNFKFAEYFKNSREAGVGQVTVIDRKDLEQYLTGQIETSAALEFAAPELDLDRVTEKDASGAAVGEALGEAEARAVDAQALDAEHATLRRILAGELQLRDRNSMLIMPGRQFHKVLALLKNVQAGAGAQPQRSKSKPKALPIAPSGRYERETAQDATLRRLGAEKLGLGLGQASEPSAKRPAAPTSQEKRLDSKRPRSQVDEGRRDTRPARALPPIGKPVARHGRPIIMVPPGLTAIVNMYNIGPLLEKGVFKTVEQCRAEGVTKSDRMVIERAIGRETPVPYEVTDREPLHRKDWARVVAVFCSGKAWQFKTWPFKGAAEGDLLDTFHRVLGIYLYFQDEQVDSTVKKWKVKMYPMSRESRHKDMVLVQDVLKSLDIFLEHKHSSLAY